MRASRPSTIWIPPLLLALAACGDDSGGGGSDTTTGTDTTVIQPDGNGGGNRPPELERIGDRVVAVGKSLVITLSAKDPDGDALTYSVFGNLPEGARFDKVEHRFEWSPSAAGVTVFLTFVVSDGTDFDRETVRIQVDENATSNPPTFVATGDQIVKPGETFSLKLVATDPDGDRLTYGHEGALPNGAELDSKTGDLTWRVPSDVPTGAPIRITFTVSDGTASDTMTVNFIVDDGSGNVPQPPTFTPPAAVTAKAGEPLSLTLQASDPNGDAVTFSIKSGAPPDATLSGATFSWTPAAGDVGKTYTVTFAATDGTLTTLGEVKISVTSGQTGACTPDAEEPNEDVAQAKPLAIGSRQASLCETESTYDTDVWAVEIPAGQQLTATLTFDATDVDVDLLLVDASSATLAASEGVTTTEQVRYSPAAAGTYYLIVYGYGLEPLSLTYTLATSLGAPTVCTDDGSEQNDTAGAAAAWGDALEGQELQICAGDADWYSFAVQCGASVEVLLDIKDGADLDLYLYDDPSASEEPVAAAITEDALEVIELTAASAGTWVLEVVGYPATTAESGYELVIDVTGGCEDDGRGNNSRATAASTSGLASGTMCCGDDWFVFAVTSGEKVTVEILPDGGAVGAVAYASNGTTQLASKDPSASQSSFSFTASATGDVYLKVTGAVGAEYVIDIAIEAGGGACTLLSCDLYDVCDAGTGACQADFCFDDNGCPASYWCEETFCVNACTDDVQCRTATGYACKSGATGGYCGVTGTRAPGAACFDHSDCQGQQVCALLDHGGYCAEIGCGSCPAGTKCATYQGQQICAKTCNTTADCRGGDGYTCTAEKTCLPSP